MVAQCSTRATRTTAASGLQGACEAEGAPLVLGGQVHLRQLRAERRAHGIHFGRQNAAEDERAARPHQRGNRRRQGDQQRAGEIGGDDVARGDRVDADISLTQRDRRLGAVEPQVFPGIDHGVLVVVEGLDVRGAEPPGGQGEDARSGPEIDGTPSGQLHLLQEPETQPGRFMVAGAEAGRRVDDHQRALGRRRGIPGRGHRDAAHGDAREVRLRSGGPILVVDLRAHDPQPGGLKARAELVRGGGKVRGVGEEDPPDRRGVVTGFVNRGRRQVVERQRHQVGQIRLDGQARKVQVETGEGSGHV